MPAPRIVHQCTWFLNRDGQTVFWIFGDDLDECSITIICRSTGEVWTGNNVRQIGNDPRRHKAKVRRVGGRRDGKDIVDDDLATVDITVTNDETGDVDTTTVEVAID